MADKRLEKVRAEFIRRVNKSIISQLLDDLLRERIMDDEELEEVHVKDKTQDQARILIDNTRTVNGEPFGLAVQKIQKKTNVTLLVCHALHIGQRRNNC